MSRYGHVNAVRYDRTDRSPVLFSQGLAMRAGCEGAVADEHPDPLENRGGGRDGEANAVRPPVPEAGLARLNVTLRIG